MDENIIEYYSIGSRVAQYRGLRPPGAKRPDRVVLTKYFVQIFTNSFVQNVLQNIKINSIKRKRKPLYQFFY